MEKIWSKIVDFFKDIPGFIESNHANPIFWVVLVLVVAGICFLTINNLGDK